MSEIKLDVRKGNELPITVKGQSFHSQIIDSKHADGAFADVFVRANGQVPVGQVITLPGCLRTGGCGLSAPELRDGFSYLVLHIKYDCIDLNTLGG